MHTLAHLEFDNDLPVCLRRDEIARAIADHQVVIVCGETGSGKSTQLPKICLSLGRGVDGLIGHTQPRRIAARSIAARIAEELRSPLGHTVGFKVRFAEQLSPQTRIKLMTDGILLAETQGDRDLRRYDTIVLDEAHERSLNVDFLIGYLKRLLTKRRDLKLIVTSATIDVARFSEHFATAAGPAPVVEVTGRMFPVEVRYRPLVPDEDGAEPDLTEAVLAAVDELARIDRGDMLIFMPTERDIHETAKALRGRPLPGDPTGNETEILPLYARLSMAEQQRVFHPGGRRRIVIATNVAESSLTVPRIRYVIDPGTARLSRYSPRTKTQRLPIEAVSRASADQRAGRCGRVGPGICIRLFSEEDYLARDRYTTPEIQRTNLAAVILQTKALRLGDLDHFPLLDPPRPEAVRDGYRTLFELGAIDEKLELTEIGRQLSRLPVDPRIGRMILAADAEACLREVLIIAAALEVQDPRERPLEKQQAADARHLPFSDEQSDFLGYLKLWDAYHQWKADLSRSQLRNACRDNFISLSRMREWLDVHRELLELVQRAGLKQRPRRDAYDAIHRAILTGLLSNLALRGDGYEYTVAGGGQANLWPGSGMFRKKAKWVVAAEVVETTRRYLRCCAKVDPRWIERLAPHLVKRTYSDLRWDGRAASAMAVERVSLFGLVIVAGRSVHYGPIDPAAARELLIRHGLVEGVIEPKPEFLRHNDSVLDDVERLQAKLRRRDLVRDEWARFEFYDRRLPADVCDGARLRKWLRENGANAGLLCMSQSDLMAEDAAAGAGDFPDSLNVEGMELPLEYRFEPGAEDDGVTLTAPLEAVRQLDPQRLDWLVPGRLEEKVLALIRSLPKSLRSRFVPAPETAKRVAAQLRFGSGEIRTAVAAALSRLAGTAILPDAFQEDRLPEHLRIIIRAVDAEGKAAVTGRDFETVRRGLGQQAAASIAELADPRWNRDGLVTWDFDEFPAAIDVRRGGVMLKAYPTLLDRGDSVSLRLSDSTERAEHQTRGGLRRLFYLAAHRELRTQVDWLPGLDKMLLHAATIAGLDLRQELALLLADRAFVADTPLPRTKEQFEGHLAAGRERIGMAVQDIAGLAGPLLEACHRASLALTEAKSPKWQEAVADIHRQMAALLDPHFLSTMPWDWLRHYLRYFRGIQLRLEALAGGSARRDQQGMAELSPRWHAYLDRVRQHEEVGVFDPELILYRWMLEEFRISLFAQKLGTALPVSAKRLDRQWEKVRA